MSEAGRRIEYLPLASLRSAKRNPKKHADNEVRASIGRFGYVEPMVLDERTGLLVAGHGRRDALSAMKTNGHAAPAGIQEDGGEWLVPVLRGWESRSDIEADAYLLASNQLTTLGGWDNKPLTEMLKELTEAGALAGVGFSDAELTKLLDAAGPKEGKTDPDDVPQVVETGFHWSSTIIWAKDSLVLSRKDYHTQYEPLWYGWQKDAARLKEVEDRKQTDLWNIARPKKSDEHPTMKPVELIERALSNSSDRGNIVLEPFSGSGSVIVACERTGRRARAIELDPKYVQVAIERWEKFTGKKAERVN